MNQIKVNQQQTIVFLHEQKWSKRRIARELPCSDIAFPIVGESFRPRDFWV